MKKGTGDILIFLLFAIIGVLLYLPAAHAGMVHDFIGWILNYDEHGAKGLLNEFGDKGMHPFYHLAFFSTYKLFHLNSYAWYLLFTSLHVLNAFLAFLFFREFIQRAEINNASAIAFWGSMFFLISPYQTENVIWKATIHYLFSTGLILGALNFFLLYTRNGRWIYLLLIHLCYIVAILFLEIGLSLPFIFLAIILFYNARVFERITAATSLLVIVLPQFIIIPFYFLSSKIFLGSWVGHYGASTHMNFSPVLWVAHFNSYLTKFLAFSQFLSFPHREHLYQEFSNPRVAWCFAFIYSLLFLGLIWYREKLSSRQKVLLTLLAMFFAGMVTTMNLFFYYITNIEDDRLSYLGSIFILVFAAATIYSFKPGIRCILLAVFTALSLKYSLYNVRSWKNNAVIRESLERSLAEYHAAKIYILASPDNYRGTYMFRSYGDTTLIAEDLLMKTGEDKRGAVRDVLYFNMNTPADSVVVEKIDSSTLKVSFAQWGNWWWTGGIGANNIATADYKLHIDEWNHSYTINFEKKAPGALYLYPSGKQWSAVRGF